jgi:hypothetical protein
MRPRRSERHEKHPHEQEKIVVFSIFYGVCTVYKFDREEPTQDR